MTLADLFESREFQRNWLLSELFAARAAMRDLEKSLSKARDEEELRISETQLDETLSEEDLSLAYQELHYHFELNIPKVLASSLFVYAYSLVEIALNDLARQARARLGLRLKLKEISGPPIDRAKVYFAKVVGIDVSALPGWQVLREFQNLRNSIVHRNGSLGEVESERNSLKALADRFQGELEVYDWSEPRAELRFGTDLVERFIAEAEKLIGALSDRLSDLEDEKHATNNVQKGAPIDEV